MVLVFLGSSFVGKTATVNALRANPNLKDKVVSFNTDNYIEVCQAAEQDFTAKAINQKIKAEVKLAKEAGKILTVDVGGCVLLDFKPAELQEFFNALGDERWIIQLRPFRDKQKSRELLHNQVGLLYQDVMKTERNQKSFKVINSQIDEILDNDLYDRIANEKMYFLQDDESPLINNYDYVSKIKIAADKLGNELAAQFARSQQTNTGLAAKTNTENLEVSL